MPTLGSTTKPGSTYHAYGGSSQINQEAQRLEAPVRLRLLELGQWVGGWAASCRVRLCVWDAAGNLLGQSAQVTAANEGSAATGHVSLYTELLLTSVEIAKGAAFYVGFNRHPDDAHQVSVGATGGDPHYEGRSGATWPNDLGNASGGPAEISRRCGSYVANYEAIAGAKVYRSGSWTDADSVQLYRSGSWTDAEAVKVYRSGAWVDAE